MLRKVIFVLSTVLSFLGPVQAQYSSDSLSLSLPEAEKIFLQNNLSLLAARYNISINKALAEQAAYWDNPTLNMETNIYDGKFFRHDVNYGEFYIQLQQLIRTAGKRNKLVKLAEDDSLSAEQQWKNLLRNLKFVLTDHYYTLYEQQQLNSIYNKEIVSLSQLSKGMDAEYREGNISLKDKLRIQSLLYNMQADQAELSRQMNAEQHDLRLLLQVSQDTVFVTSTVHPFSETLKMELPPLQTLLDSAFINRPDLGQARLQILNQQHNLAYQKALAAPDLTTGLQYDNRNSYVPNYFGLALSLPLPLFNRNRGAIKAASLGIEQAEITRKDLQNQVTQDVSMVYKNLYETRQRIASLEPEFDKQYEDLLEKMTESFRQRQVSLIEFIDFFDSYRETRNKRIHQEILWRTGLAELNYTTNCRFSSLY